MKTWMSRFGASIFTVSLFMLGIGFCGCTSLNLAGARCEADSECELDLFCVSQTKGGKKSCEAPCKKAADCDADETCAVLAREDGLGKTKFCQSQGDVSPENE